MPDLAARKGASRKSLVWSAGCSTGEEPYTLAMVLSEYARSASRLSVQRAGNRYLHRCAGQGRAWESSSPRCVAPVPAEPAAEIFHAQPRSGVRTWCAWFPKLRALIEFRRLNFMDSDFGLAEPPEIIFCRNVIIYFDRPTQVRLLEKLTRQLAPGGYFFAGHSESLQRMDLPLVPVGPAVYRKRVMTDDARICRT